MHRGPSIAALAAVLLMAASSPAAGQDPEDGDVLYLTDDDVSVHGVTGFLLSPEQPSGGAATTMLSALPGLGPASVAWYTRAPVTADLVATGPATITLSFNAGAEAVGTITVALVAVQDAGAMRELGATTQEVSLSAAPRTETFEVPLDEAVVEEGAVLGLVVSVGGGEVLVNVQHNDGTATIEGLDVSVLDSDDDGFSDSAERAAGSDPDDPASTPGSGERFFEPAGEGDRIEPVIASGFLLLCLAVAGIGLLRRSMT